MPSAGDYELPGLSGDSLPACLDRLSQALLQAANGAPPRSAQLLGRRARVPDIAGPCGKMDESRVGLRQLEDPVGDFVDGCLVTIATVVCASQVAVFGDEQ